MKRWWVVIALLLSVGVNVGILAALATRRAASRFEEAPPRREEPPPFAGSGPAEGPPPRGGPGPEEGGELPPRLGRLADHLGLEGEVRRRFLEIQRQFFEETTRARLQMAETQREVRRELIAEEPDRERIEQLLQESARAFLALERALAKNVVASREILDREQERELLRIISRMRPPGPGGFGQPQQPPRRRPGGPGRFPGDRRGYPGDRRGLPDDRRPDDRFEGGPPPF